MGSGFEPDYKAIGNRIKQARKRQKITQKKLAEMTDLSTSHMSHIESGKTKVSLPSLIQIANALHTTVDSLLHDNIRQRLQRSHGRLHCERKRNHFPGISAGEKCTQTINI